VIRRFKSLICVAKDATIVPDSTSRQELVPMANECKRGCPECSMSHGWSSPLANVEGQFQCSVNPAHRFRVDESGFLKSL
jgi:hypothetical protein